MLVPSEGHEGGSVPDLSPWHVDGCLFIVFPLRVSVSKFPLAIRTSVLLG